MSERWQTLDRWLVYTECLTVKYVINRQCELFD